MRSRSTRLTTLAGLGLMVVGFGCGDDTHTPANTRDAAIGTGGVASTGGATVNPNGGATGSGGKFDGAAGAGSGGMTGAGGAAVDGPVDAPGLGGAAGSGGIDAPGSGGSTGAGETRGSEAGSEAGLVADGGIDTSGCSCAGNNTTWDCLCAAYDCGKTVDTYAGGLGKSYVLMREYAGCNLVEYWTLKGSSLAASNCISRPS